MWLRVDGFEGGICGLDLDYWDSTWIMWIRLGFYVDYSDSTGFIGIRRFVSLVPTWTVWISCVLGLEYLVLTICGLGLDLVYLALTWII